MACKKYSGSTTASSIRSISNYCGTTHRRWPGVLWRWPTQEEVRLYLVLTRRIMGTRSSRSC